MSQSVDWLYDVTLFTSFASGVAALAVAVLGRVQARPAPAFAGVVVPAALGAWIAVLVSFAVHLAWGHAPGGPNALPLLEFVRHHPSFIVAAAIPGLALVARPKRARQPSTR